MATSWQTYSKRALKSGMTLKEASKAWKAGGKAASKNPKRRKAASKNPRRRKATTIKISANPVRKRRIRNASRPQVRAAMAGTTAPSSARYQPAPAEAPAKAAPARRTKRAAPTGGVKALKSKIDSLMRGFKTARTKSAGKRRPSTPAFARLAALRAQMKAMAKGKRGYTAAQKKYMEQYGLVKVNPSFKDISTNLMRSLPQIGMVLGGMVGVGFVAAKTVPWLSAKVPPSVLPYLPAGGAGLLTVLGYAAMRLFGMEKYSMPFLLGGGALTGVMTLSAVQVGDVSLSRKLGLPIGDPLLPGITTGLNLRGYLPRSDLSGSYEKRSSFAAFDPGTSVAGYLPRSVLAGSDANLAAKVRELTSLAKADPFAGA